MLELQRLPGPLSLVLVTTCTDAFIPLPKTSMSRAMTKAAGTLRKKAV
jgi:thymidine phosphorylase